MKLKEYPKSFLQQFKLRSLNQTALTQYATRKSVPAVVSLTTIPSRLHVVDITVRSLLVQDTQPEKVILWLNDELKNDVPAKLRALENDRFEIRYEHGTSSHRKLVYSLEAFPDKTIITCDDDLMYPKCWLSRLWQEHINHPADIVAHECRSIQYGGSGEVLPYKEWKGCPSGHSDNNTLAIGYGGTLYPVKCLHPDVLNEDLYLELTPKADDLWFKAMALLNGTSVRRTLTPSPRPVPIARSQKIALGHTNIKKDGNRDQWQALCDYYQFNQHG